MENNNNQKVGAGILVVSILTIIGSVFSLLGLIFTAAFKDSLNSALASTGQDLKITTSYIAITALLAVLLLVSAILILTKKTVGVYLYFVCVIANIIYTLATTGFKATIIISFVLPILMAVFIAQKKELYGFGSKSENVNI